jgi:hypothetical protein
VWLKDTIIIITIIINIIIITLQHW